MSNPPNYHGVTMQHVANLRNHAEFVRGRESISMKYFAVDGDNMDVQPEHVHECGSAMCAIGLVPLNPAIDIGEVSIKVSWGDVSIRAFGFDGWGALPSTWEQTFGNNLPSDPDFVADGMLKTADYLEVKIKEGAA